MRDNVTITDEPYVGPRGGFGVEDYLIPQRPTTTADMWFEPYPDSARLSLSGGLSNPSGNQQSEQKADTGLKAEDVDLSRVQPQRRRRSFGVQAIARGIDLFDMISGVDKDAYLGKTLANEIEYEKKLAEEDPEGYQADVNRAKLLSQRAYETEDVELKKKYGAAIKKLLPAETAGLDDLTASAYYTGNEKMEIEKLKASTQLAREKVKGEYGLQKQELSNENRIDVQGMKNDARKEHDALQYELELAKKDKDFERYAMIRDRMAELKEFEKAADYEREVMKQMEANYRTEYAADQGLAGRMYTADLGLEGRQYTADQGLAGRMYTADQSLAGRMYTADRSLEGRKYAADMAHQNALVAADARIRTAKNSSNGVDVATGDIIPSGGVVEAMNFIEENPDLFSATNALIDTRLGRAIGALSEDTIEMRDTVKQELSTLVRASVQNLMQLFPKGGSGVINTAKEQEFFVPVAAAIASGERNKIVPAVKSFYGQMYDACAASGEKPLISRAEYIKLMTTGSTSDGRTRITRGGTGNSSSEAPSQQKSASDFGGYRTKDGFITLSFD